MKPPVFEIDPVAFKSDLYPFLERMRAEAPICHVPQLNAVLLTRRDDIFTCEKNIEVFSSEQPNGLMTKLMGQNMMRKDGEAHMSERRMIFPAVSPKTVKNIWLDEFRHHAETILDELTPRATMNVAADYAMRLSGEALKLVTGLTQIGWKDMDVWSQGTIDGIANYAGDPEIEAHCKACTDAIDQAITERLPAIAKSPDHSILGAFHQAGMPEENIRHNVKLAISGGQNEPRDAIAGCIWAMLTHPDQLEMVRAGKAGWMQVFDEYCRWNAPIGMSPRRIAKAFQYKGVEFVPEQLAFLMFGSANRDEACFVDPNRFDITRDTAKSVAFGAGPHFCAGAWVSRALVASVALPLFFEKLQDIHLVDEVELEGWAFRGPKAVNVAWRV